MWYFHHEREDINLFHGFYHIAWTSKYNSNICRYWWINNSLHNRFMRKGTMQENSVSVFLAKKEYFDAFFRLLTSTQFFAVDLKVYTLSIASQTTPSWYWGNLEKVSWCYWNFYSIRRISRNHEVCGRVFTQSGTEG